MGSIPIVSNKMLYEQALKSIPGGVNSPVRAFGSVGGTPVFMQSASGAIMTDSEGKQYIDYINSWGPMILGHGRQEVVQSIQEQADKAISFGTCTEKEIHMAELVKSMVPNVDQIRLVSSGTEACMTALRLARGYTRKNKFIKFEGNYHGHADPFLLKAGSGVATLGIDSVGGVTAGATKDTLIAPYNDLQAVESLMEQHSDDMAAIILEPVAGNMGCIVPEPSFLQGLRDLCDQYKAVLIFDEVMTGFRLAPGGVQQRLGIRADIVTYGKVIGGGMPIGAIAARNEIMQCLAPLGKVYQAGTLSGNPLALAAGISTLSILKDNPQIYSDLDRKTIQLRDGIKGIMEEKGIPFCINQMGSMLSLHFSDAEVTNYSSAAACDIECFNEFFHHLLSQGVYLPPSAYESWFISDALSQSHIDQTLSAISKFRS